jgi:peptidoglycan/xylan/chitin deacetylase (PgdA/CDA1 family)
MSRQNALRWGAALVGAALSACAPAVAGPPACDRPGGVGTYRTLTVQPRSHVGAAEYAALPLEDKEVVLTFDDGPNPDSTPLILRTLADHCVLATFFPIGAAARENPGLLNQVIAAGHSMGGHTEGHENLSAMPIAAAEAAMRDGFEPLSDAGQRPAFFRFPELADSPALLAYADAQGLAVIGVDIDPSDWSGDPPRETLARLKAAIIERRRGIILMHDSQPNTAAFLPDLLAWLRDNGYRVSHIAPATQRAEPAAAAAAP